MNPIAKFMTKYNAVPATDRGPDWLRATVDALLDWAAKDCDLWQSGTQNAHIRKRLMDIGVELDKRESASPGTDPRLMDMMERIFELLDVYWEPPQEKSTDSLDSARL